MRKGRQKSHPFDHEPQRCPATLFAHVPEKVADLAVALEVST